MSGFECTRASLAGVTHCRRIVEEGAVKPRRIQLSRKKGWRKPEGAVVVARPSKWGNPFAVGDVVQLSDRGDVAVQHRPLRVVDNAVAVALFRAAFYGQPAGARTAAERWIRNELAGKDLACWCPLSAPCHADVLLELANTEPSR